MPGLSCFKQNYAKITDLKVFCRNMVKRYICFSLFLFACPEFLWLNLLFLEELVLAELSQGLQLCRGWESSLGVPQLLLDGRQVGWLVYLFILVQKDKILESEFDS